MSSTPMNPNEAVILVLEQTRPGGILEGFALVEVRSGIVGHQLWFLDTASEAEQQYGFNTSDYVLPDAEWDQSPDDLLKELRKMRAMGQR